MDIQNTNCSMNVFFFPTQGLVEVLSDDNIAFEIPSYLRKNLELDLQTRPEKLPSGLLLQVNKFKML